MTGRLNMSNRDVLSFVCMDWVGKLETYLLLLTFCQRPKVTANIICKQIIYVLQKQFLQIL